MAGRMSTHWRLEFTGRVATPTSFDYLTLVEMSSLHDTFGFGVALIDVLATAGLDADAEILVASDASGGSFAVPLRHVVAADGARLTLGSRRSPVGLDDGFPVRLDIPGWTDSTRAVTVESLRATDFAEFVGST